MTNADKFKHLFGIYAAELWAMHESDFLEWLNADAQDIPTAERKTGKWIYSEDEHGIDGYHCDKCGFFVPWFYAHKFINYIEDYNFCPSCGADMRGDDNETD